MSLLEPEMAPPRLLLVESDRHSIDDLRDAFFEAGYECEVALDVDTARTILDERQMDLAVVNAKMTAVKDETLVRELQARAPDMLIVIYNGTKDKKRQRRLRRLGAAGYLSAASDLSAVIRSVQRILQEQ